MTIFPLSPFILIFLFVYVKGYEIIQLKPFEPWLAAEFLNSTTWINATFFFRINAPPSHGNHSHCHDYHESGHDNGSDSNDGYNNKNLDLNLDSFDNKHSIHRHLQLHVTDAFCSGDTFSIYLNDILRRTSPIVPIDGCVTNQTNPSLAWYDERFSKVAIPLSVGLYKLRIKVENSPFSAGKLFMRIGTENQDNCRGGRCDEHYYFPTNPSQRDDYEREMERERGDWTRQQDYHDQNGEMNEGEIIKSCKEKDFTIIFKHVTFKKADKTCRKVNKNLKLATLDKKKFKKAIKAIEKCIADARWNNNDIKGEERKDSRGFWIDKKWDNDSNENFPCLELRIGKENDNNNGNRITVPHSCNQKNLILCEKKNN